MLFRRHNHSLSHHQAGTPRCFSNCADPAVPWLLCQHGEEPVPAIQHLGAVIDSTSCQVFLSPDRLSNLRRRVKHCSLARSVPIIQLSQLLGIMISCLGVVPWARLHARELQWFLLPVQRARNSNSLRRVRLPRKVIRSLAWWRSKAVRKGCLFKEPERLVVTTDASLLGWGAHCQGHLAQGRWTQREAAHSINWLELRAARLALRKFASLVRGAHVLLMTDNVATKAHINRQGGTRSKALMLEAEALGRWAERHLASLSADHISGVSNREADWLSRQRIDHSEWRLHPDLFQQIVRRFGKPQVDLFATHSNTQLP
ncbi:PREDICTED: uncharacterized protein LOC106537516 [Thamnophis sirtalis]|uniref:Uncharacterized protein LOC106537516 n=1 Tax=Thamnophis sirtalis TaxID=35019 RepID=A0A6I9X064_9SAUR|nr:PREDICTED: uncharacterized protein LOC106537516 [Thamnophis sirtalis]